MLITTLSDGTTIEQDRGSFDDYCVYITRPGKQRYAPHDDEYFSFFIVESTKYTPQKIYEDFVEIYNRTTKDIDRDVIDNLIVNISQDYINDVNEFILWFTVIYLGMIAEENKLNAVLKKRIKRLGMYQILLEGYTAQQAANYSKGKKVKELNPICKQRGF